MHALGRLDIGTLMVCIALATLLYSYAFFRLWGTHRSLRGSGAFALAFLIAAITCILIPFVEPSTPTLARINILVGDTMALVLYAFLLTGIEQFLGERHLIRLAWLLALISLALNIYFTCFHDSLVGRLLINASFTFLYRLILGIELFGHPPRKHLRVLAWFMFVFALISLAGVGSIAVNPHPRTAEQWLQSHGAESISVFLQFVFVLGTGQLLFLLLNGELLNQVETEATRDYITGTLNRRGIERVLVGEVGRSGRFGMPLSVGLVDIDGFKQINDSLGHAEGDRALLAVSRCIQKSLRAYDTVGRFGGDEFLVILPNSTAVEALKVMERLRMESAQMSAEAITLSIGVTSMVANEPHCDLLARADRALYLAKQDGRNCTRMSLARPEHVITAEAPSTLPEASL
jgi:diguanylate cyclase (GGDEF)-like protein